MAVFRTPAGRNRWRKWTRGLPRKPSGDMRAIDTNVIVRFLTGDDPEQAARVRAVIGQAPAFVPRTVLLEAEWVLRGVYGLPADKIISTLQALAGLPGVVIEDAALVAKAMDWAEAGMGLRGRAAPGGVGRVRRISDLRQAAGACWGRVEPYSGGSAMRQQMRVLYLSLQAFPRKSGQGHCPGRTSALSAHGCEAGKSGGGMRKGIPPYARCRVRTAHDLDV